MDVIWLAGRELVIAGADTGPRSVSLPARARSSGIRLRPGAAGVVLGLPAAELRDRQVAAALVWREQAPGLEDGLAGAAPARRLELLADAVARRRAEPDALVAAAARRLGVPASRVANVASELGVSSGTTGSGKSQTVRSLLESLLRRGRRSASTPLAVV